MPVTKPVWLSMHMCRWDLLSPQALSNIVQVLSEDCGFVPLSGMVAWFLDAICWDVVKQEVIESVLRIMENDGLSNLFFSTTQDAWHQRCGDIPLMYREECMLLKALDNKFMLSLTQGRRKKHLPSRVMHMPSRQPTTNSPIDVSQSTPIGTKIHMPSRQLTTNSPSDVSQPTPIGTHMPSRQPTTNSPSDVSQSRHVDTRPTMPMPCRRTGPWARVFDARPKMPMPSRRTGPWPRVCDARLKLRSHVTRRRLLPMNTPLPNIPIPDDLLQMAAGWIEQD